jgi:hypothetical protein
MAKFEPIIITLLYLIAFFFAAQLCNEVEFSASMKEELIYQYLSE